jgi:hypothetical protein
MSNSNLVARLREAARNAVNRDLLTEAADFIEARARAQADIEREAFRGGYMRCYCQTSPAKATDLNRVIRDQYTAWLEWREVNGGQARATTEHSSAVDTPAPPDVERVLEAHAKQDAVFTTAWADKSDGAKALSVAALRVAANDLATHLRAALADLQREREARERAEAERDDLNQTSGDLCPECGWRGKRSDGCEFCLFQEVERERDSLRTHLAEARAELAGLKAKESVNA